MFQENVSLLPFNTFHINCAARFFARFSSVDALEEMMQSYQKVAPPHSPLLILGGGSNVLLTGDFNGWVGKNEMTGISKIAEDDQHVYVKAGAGESWHGLVQYCLANDWAGVENLALIPGSVGASPMQNIGAYGVELQTVFHSLEAYHIETGEIVVFGLNDCAFGYRESIFKQRYKNQFVILNVTYRLSKTPQFNTSYGAIEQELEQMGVASPSIQSIAEAVIRIRSSKLPDPAVLGNAGSFFKNPTISTEAFYLLKAQFPDIVGYPSGNGYTKLAAGWLIEQCGWKGYRKGDAGCHARQALVLVNYGHATGNEILQLSSAIIGSVQEKFGVRLEREVNLIAS